MKPDEFKEKAREILNCEIVFDGHIKKVLDGISEKRQNKILDWLKECRDGGQAPEPCKNFKKLVSFIYKSNDNRIRGILTKEKNSFFIELFLDKHKYYDRKRKYLGI